MIFKFKLHTASYAVSMQRQFSWTGQTTEAESSQQFGRMYFSAAAFQIYSVGLLSDKAFVCCCYAGLGLWQTSLRRDSIAAFQILSCGGKVWLLLTNKKPVNTTILDSMKKKKETHS
jgi:hypothetical protein